MFTDFWKMKQDNVKNVPLTVDVIRTQMPIHPDKPAKLSSYCTSSLETPQPGWTSRTGRNVPCDIVPSLLVAFGRNYLTGLFISHLRC